MYSDFTSSFKSLVNLRANCATANAHPAGYTMTPEAASCWFDDPDEADHFGEWLEARGYKLMATMGGPAVRRWETYGLAGTFFFESPLHALAAVA